MRPAKYDLTGQTFGHEAVMMANAALTMAALARLYRDTVKDIAGGDMLDMIEGGISFIGSAFEVNGLTLKGWMKYGR